VNSNQQTTVNQLVVAFCKYRGLDANYQSHISEDGKAHVQFDLTNFPLIVIGASGKPDMPEVPTYSESNEDTALDAWASHVTCAPLASCSSHWRDRFVALGCSAMRATCCSFWECLRHIQSGYHSRSIQVVSAVYERERLA
jgi:hypothetical protein